MRKLSKLELKQIIGGRRPMFGQGYNGFDPNSCHFTTVGGPNEVVCVCNWQWCHFDFWIPNHCSWQSNTTAPSACFANGSTIN